MPTYDYRCKDCNHEFEIHQSMSEDALTDCPECNGALRKVFSAVGISFKGSGFYKNDSGASGSSSTGAGSSTATSTSTDSSSSSSASSSDKSSSSDSSASKSSATASTATASSSSSSD